MDSVMGSYLKPTATIDSDALPIQEKARALTSDEENVIGAAQSLFYFVRDHIRYNLYVSKSRPEYFRASATLERGDGYCVQKAVLLVALARAVDIPAALGFARLRNHLLPEKTRKWLGGDILPFHGYAELYLDGRWVKATPAFDAAMCEKHRIIPVEFDGTSDAVFHPCNQEGKPHIEYLADLGHLYDDLPFDRLRQALVEKLGEGMLDPPQR
ncbi:MAG: transglutaminase-like domain-containing protein [Chloroflexota bacterium]